MSIGGDQRPRDTPRLAERCAAQDVRRPAVRDPVADRAARDRSRVRAARQAPGQATARCPMGHRAGACGYAERRGQPTLQLPTDGDGLLGPLTVKPNDVDCPALRVRL